MRSRTPALPTALAALAGLLWVGPAMAASTLDEVDNRLAAMGVSNAAAYAAADSYVHRPRSACAKLVRRALGGDRKVAEEINNGETPCTR